MAKSKTGSFWLTDRVMVAAADVGTPQVGTIDLGSYVDVGDQQALAIEQVDFIYQSADSNGAAQLIRAGSNGDLELACQLTDLNPNGLIVFADDSQLVASGTLFWDAGNNAVTTGSDFYPDNFGKLDEARMVVNDTLYVVLGSDGAVAAGEYMSCTVRIKARIVKLTSKDWMAIAIQSTAADN